MTDLAAHMRPAGCPTAFLLPAAAAHAATLQGFMVAQLAPRAPYQSVCVTPKSGCMLLPLCMSVS